VSHASTRNEADIEKILSAFLAEEVVRADRLASLDSMTERVSMRRVPAGLGPGIARLAWVALSLLVVLTVTLGTVAILGGPHLGVTFPVSSPTLAATPDVAVTARPSLVATRYAGMIAAVALDGSAVAIDPVTGETQILVACPPGCSPITSPTWSPDGAQLAYVRTAPADAVVPQDAGVWIRDLTSNTDRRITTCHLTAECPLDAPLAWSPDGTRLALLEAGDLVVMTLDGAQKTLGTIGGAYPQGTNVAWSADGQVIRVAVGRTWEEFNADGSGQRPMSLHAGSLEIASPDGSRVAYVTDDLEPAPSGGAAPDQYDAVLWVAAPDGSRPIEVASIPGCCVSGWFGSAAWSSDGRQLAWIGPRTHWVGDGQKLIVVNADGSGLRTLAPVLGISRAAWSPLSATTPPAPASPVPPTTPPTAKPSPRSSPIVDPAALRGTVAVSTGAAIVAVDPATGAQTMVFACESVCFNTSTPTWSPDGRQLAYMIGSDIWIRDLVSGQSRAVVTCGAGNCAEPGFLAWSPDGSTLAYFGGGDLTIVSVADGSVQQLTHDHAALQDTLGVLEWTPDSQSLRYEMNATRHQVDRDGSNATLLPAVGDQGAWVATSPSGALAYITDDAVPSESGQSPSGDPFTAQLWVLQPGSTAPIEVARQAGCCIGASMGGAPAWSPDGRQLAWVVYAGHNGGDHHLIVANADGSGSQQVMTTDAIRPDWYPKGEQP
jgi:Tol biopolymer transport system component